MRISVAIVLLVFALLSPYSAKRYTYQTYNEILSKMREFAQKYPRYCRLVDVRNEYNNLIETKCGKYNCEHWYLEIADFSLPTEKLNSLPQAFYLAGIHGDEQLGPNILTYLAEYLLQKNEEDEDITRLIKSRYLILLPMANPSGFYLNIREEKQGFDSIFDPNRDFPYNIRDARCLKTTSARVINHIFKKYLIQATITFHGGQQVISYPWGAFNHISGTVNGRPAADECPDDKAFADIANIMSKEAGANPFLFIKQYPTGKMTDTVYAVDGGLEDWAYGASWETQISPNVISKCEAASPNFPSSETEYHTHSVRSLVYLIETAFSKAPTSAYLGSSEGLENSQDRYAYGYIPMNIKLCVALTDLLEPYVKLKSIDYSDERKAIIVQWQAGGCKSVDETSVEWTEKDSNVVNKLNPRSGPGYYENKDYIFEEAIATTSTSFNMALTIKLSCDQSWAKQQSPKPVVGPQTHVVQARVDQNYYAEVNGFKVTGKKVVEMRIEDITTEYLMKTRITNLQDLTLVIQVMECSNFNSVGSISLQLNSNNLTSLTFSGKLNIQDPFLEGHLRHYGDVSRCLESLGETVSITSFKSDPEYDHSRLFVMEKDDIKSVKVGYDLQLQNQQDILNLIGRGIVLERKSHPDKVYVGQIVPVQSTSCSKAKEMKNCIGVDLGPREGICILNLGIDDTLHNFKLLIRPEPGGKSVNIQGLIPTAIIEHYNNFEEIYIVHEKTEKKFFLSSQKVSGYGLIEPNTFNLYSDIALGSLLRVYIQAFGDRLLLGDCSIVLKDPTFDETTHLMDHSTTQQNEKSSPIRTELLFFLVGCVVIALVGLSAIVLSKRYKRLKQRTFAVVMSARKEKYADTAIMINSTRGVGSARAPGSNGGQNSVNTAPSARLGLGVLTGSTSAKGTDSQKVTLNSKHQFIEFKENSLEDESQGQE